MRSRTCWQCQTGSHRSIIRLCNASARPRTRLTRRHVDLRKSLVTYHPACVNCTCAMLTSPPWPAMAQGWIRTSAPCRDVRCTLRICTAWHLTLEVHQQSSSIFFASVLTCCCQCRLNISAHGTKDNKATLKALPECDLLMFDMTTDKST